MLVSIASHDWSYTPTEIVELDEEIAQAWIECGHAEPVESPKKSTKK